MALRRKVVDLVRLGQVDQVTQRLASDRSP
jgi:hypothetical protein